MVLGAFGGWRRDGGEAVCGASLMTAGRRHPFGARGGAYSCFYGGDVAHRMALEEAWNTIQNCDQWKRHKECYDLPQLPGLIDRPPSSLTYHVRAIP